MVENKVLGPQWKKGRELETICLGLSSCPLKTGPASAFFNFYFT